MQWIKQPTEAAVPMMLAILFKGPPLQQELIRKRYNRIQVMVYLRFEKNSPKGVRRNSSTVVLLMQPSCIKSYIMK